MKKFYHYLQTASFCSFLVCASGDTWNNLVGVIISLTAFVLLTWKLNGHGWVQ